jgi:hypothetical protein
VIGDNVKAITIKQPFASLIASGLKEYEFRTWKTNYRGKIYIHAGLGTDAKAIEKFKDYNLEYPKGEIIAVAELVDCIIIDEEVKKELQEKNSLVYSGVIHDTSFQGYGFQLANIRKVKPISVKGKLGLWNYEPEKLEE